MPDLHGPKEPSGQREPIGRVQVTRMDGWWRIKSGTSRQRTGPLEWVKQAQVRAFEATSIGHAGLAVTIVGGHSPRNHSPGTNNSISTRIQSLEERDLNQRLLTIGEKMQVVSLAENQPCVICSVLLLGYYLCTLSLSIFWAQVQQ